MSDAQKKSWQVVDWCPAHNLEFELNRLADAGLNIFRVFEHGSTYGERNYTIVAFDPIQMTARMTATQGAAQLETLQKLMGALGKNVP